MLKNDRITWALKWTGTIITLAGALCTSLRIDPLNVYLLNLGSLVFVLWAVRIRERAMITVNVGLLSIYLVGLFFTR